MDKEKNLLLIGGVVVLGLVLVYLLFFSNPQKTNNIERVYNIDGDEVEGSPYYYADLPKVNEKTFIPKTNWSLNDCESMDSSESKNECFKAVAISEGNESICNKISDIDLKNLCLIDIAYYYERVELCEKSIEAKSECALDLALKTSNAKYCDKTNIEQETCKQAFLEKNKAKCSTLTLGRFECTQAIEDNNINKCFEIQSFEDACNHILAIKNHDEKLCEKLSTTELKDTCFFRIALDTNNIDTCNKMSTGIDNCIAWIAINTNNINLCYQAGTEKQSCIEDIQYINQ